MPNGAYVIYEPRGRALEYSPLACNLYTGCTNACNYCFAKKVLRLGDGERFRQFYSESKPRKHILDLLLRDAKRLFHDDRVVLFCFVCDPYPENSLPTRAALEIMQAHYLKVSILTKGGMRASRDFDLLEGNRWQFGTTLTSMRDDRNLVNEPFAASFSDRASAIKLAHARGIRTWVSLEPVLYPDDVIEIISLLHPYVTEWKIGPLNYDPRSVELSGHYRAFGVRLKRLISELPQDIIFTFKKDMVPYVEN
jgi:DNA repair photolyase